MVGKDTIDEERLRKTVHEMKGVCIAPVRSAIPQEFRKYFPESLLNSAAVDSYSGERLLVPLFHMIFVHPRLGHNFEINYVSRNSVVTELKFAVSPGLFDILLMYDYISEIEHSL